MQDASTLNGFNLKDKKAREDIANLDLSKVNHTFFENEKNLLVEMINQTSQNLNELETLFNESALSGNAVGINYDNTTSGMNATNVQAAIDKLNEHITAKEIGLDFPTYNVDIISRNACFKQNGTYYIDVLITNYNEVPETATSYLRIIEDGQPITFVKRVDVFLQSYDGQIPLITNAGSTELIPNSTKIPPEIYRLTFIYRP